MSELVEEEIPDDVIATMSDYLDGALAGDAKADVEKRLAEGGVWKKAHDELVEQREFLSGMQKARAPVTFAQDITTKMNKRSGGRLFARRGFGDGGLFAIVAVAAVLGLIVIAWMMWSSSTGSLKSDKKPTNDTSGSAQIAPKP